MIYDICGYEYECEDPSFRTPEFRSTSNDAAPLLRGWRALRDDVRAADEAAGSDRRVTLRNVQDDITFVRHY